MKADTENLHDHCGMGSYRKEKGFYRQISIICPRDGSSIVTARFYWPGRDGASNCYACVWIWGGDSHGHGGGKAGGYGYHKESAALESALHNAGVYLSENIGGRGDSAIRDALTAVARAVTGRRRFFIIEAHA